MCGRAAQSISTVLEASILLGAKSQAVPIADTPAQNAASLSSSSLAVATKSPYHENVQNMSPGYTLYVFHKQQEDESAAVVTTTPMVWGLVTRPGTRNQPIPPGPSKHFANLMFNARSEEAPTKVTFGKLLRNQKSCVIALDGFYEWKSDGKRRQPYFVHPITQRQPLLVAGLYTSVPMGGTQQEEASTMLTTFTIFTTQASTQLSWLHTRMPLILLTNTKDALEWIHKPSSELLVKLAEQQEQHQLAWYPVTQKMNSSSYKGYDCMDPIPLGTTPSIKSFFTSKVPSIQDSPRPGIEKKQAHNNITPHKKTTGGIMSSHGQLMKRKSVMEEEQKDEAASTTKPCKKEKHNVSHDVQPSKLLSPRYSERSQSKSVNNMTMKKTNTNHKTIQSFFVTKPKPL
jgi:putative SOS response-associated peptidase YedK